MGSPPTAALSLDGSWAYISTCSDRLDSSIVSKSNGFQILERFKQEGERESARAKSTDRSQLQNLLTFCVEQGPRPFRGRVQPDALCARQRRPFRVALAPAIAWHFASLSH